MTLEGQEVIWVIVGAVGGSLVIIILFCLIIYKICRPDPSHKKKKHVKEVTSSKYNSNSYNSYPDHPLPSGIWTTNPGVFAATPSDVYAYNSGKPQPSREFKSGLVERTFSEPSLARAPLVRNTVRRVHSLVKHVPVAFQLRLAPGGKYYKYPAPHQHRNPSKKQRREKEVKQFQMTLDDDLASVHTSSKQGKSVKGEVVARAYSNYSIERSRADPDDDHVVKAYSNYSQQNGDINYHPGNQTNASVTRSDSFLRSDPELHKRAATSHTRQLSAPIKRVQSHIESGQRNHVGARKLLSAPAQNARDQGIARGRVVSANSTDRKNRLSAQSSIPPQHKIELTQSYSLDRRAYPNQDAKHIQRHQSAAEQPKKSKQLIANKNDPVRNNFVLKKNNDAKARDPPRREPSSKHTRGVNDVVATPQISPERQFEYFSSEPVLNKHKHGEIPYTVPYDKIDPRYAIPSEINSSTDGLDKIDQVQSSRPDTPVAPTSALPRPSDIEYKVAYDGDPNALYAVSSNVTRRQSQKLGVNCRQQEPRSSSPNATSLPYEATNGRQSPLTVHAVIESPSAKAMPSPKHIDSDGERFSTKDRTLALSAFSFLDHYQTEERESLHSYDTECTCSETTRGETITESAFAFLDVYDDVRSVDQEVIPGR